MDGMRLLLGEVREEVLSCQSRCSVSVWKNYMLPLLAKNEADTHRLYLPMVLHPRDMHDTGTLQCYRIRRG